MELRINEDELKVLAYLHETAKGYGEQFSTKMPEVVAETGLEIDDFVKGATYLHEWGMIGFNRELQQYGGPKLPPLYLTGHGEAYMREVDQRLQDKQLLPQGKRLGLAALKVAMDGAVKVAVSVFTEMAKRHTPGQG